MDHALRLFSQLLFSRSRASAFRATSTGKFHHNRVNSICWSNWCDMIESPKAAAKQTHRCDCFCLYAGSLPFHSHVDFLALRTELFHKLGLRADWIRPSAAQNDTQRSWPNICHLKMDWFGTFLIIPQRKRQTVEGQKNQNYLKKTASSNIQ